MRSRPVLVLGALAAAAAGVVWTVGRTLDAGKPEGPRFALGDGAARTYRLEWTSRAQVRMEQDGGGAGSRGSWSVVGGGDLSFRYFAAPGGWQVAAQLREAHLALGGAPVALGRFLGAPFTFRQDSLGYLTGFAFPPALPEEARSALRQVVSRLQVVLPEQDRDRWRARERDALGLFRADYARSTARPLILTKHKLEYLPTGEGSDGGGTAHEVVSSETELELLPGLRGVARAQCRETLRATGPAPFQGEEETVFEARLLVDPAADGGSPSRWADVERALEQWRAPPPLAGAAPDPRSPSPATLDRALATFRELFSGDRATAEAAVLAWLRTHPGAPDELVAFLERCSRGREPGAPGAAQQAALFRLLAQAGTPESLEALVAAATRDDLHPRTRRMAVAHMDQVSVADPSQVRALFAVHDAARRGEGSAPGSDELANMSILAAGALGHRGLAPPAVADQVVAGLEQRLQAAGSDAERVEALLAMGNCGDDRLMPSLETQLGSADPNVRGAAAHALRRIDSSKVLDVVARSFGAEPVPEVRAALVASLEPDLRGLEWARGELLRTRDQAPLLALVDLLGRARDQRTENEGALRTLLRAAPGEAVERRILRYIAPTSSAP